MKIIPSQGASKPWMQIETDDGYYEFGKKLYIMPDEGKTSVDLTLTFNTDAHMAYYTLRLSNDSGKPAELEIPGGRNYLSWATAKEMLGDEVKIPQELIDGFANDVELVEKTRAAVDPAVEKKLAQLDGASTEAWHNYQAARTNYFVKRNLALTAHASVGMDVPTTPSAQVASAAVKAPVPVTPVANAYTYAALRTLSREVNSCSEFAIQLSALEKPQYEIADDATITAIVDALDFQQTGKPDFMSDRMVVSAVSKRLRDSYGVRIDIGGPDKYHHLEQEEVDVIVHSLDAMDLARQSTFINDGLDAFEGNVVQSAYDNGYPWQTGYDRQDVGGAVQLDSVGVTRLSHLYTSKGCYLRDAIRHAEILGRPVLREAYERLQALTVPALTSDLWKDGVYRELLRVGDAAAQETHLIGLSLPSVGDEQLDNLAHDAKVDEAYVRKSLSNWCSALEDQSVTPINGVKTLLLDDEFVHETLRRAAGAFEYVTWAKDEPLVVFHNTLNDSIRMWMIAHMVAVMPENVKCLKESMRCGEDPYFNGYFGAGAARWEHATFIVGNQLVAARTDESGLTHMVLFVGDSDPNQWKATNALVIDAMRKLPNHDGAVYDRTFGSLLIERSFPKQVSRELAQIALEVVRENCTDINDSRAILKTDALGFTAGTDVKQVIAWLSEHGATTELVAESKQSKPDYGPSAP